MKGKAMGMGAAALVVSGGVLASRVLGLGRETMLAALIGVNAVGDVYRAAFLVPDLLNYLLAGGYLTITFVPILAARLAANDPEGGNRAFVAVFRVVTGVTALLTAVLMIWTAPLIELIYPELSPAQLGEVTRLTMIALPAQVFFVGGSLLMAYQYAHRRFLIPVAAPIVYNLSIIVGGMVGGILVDPPPADGFVWGALAGAALGNFGIQWWGARRVGLRLVKGVAWKHPAVRTYLALALPLMVGQSVAVLDEQFVRLFGQLTAEGGISALSFARVLNMVPVGMVAQAAGVAAFPFLASLAAAGRRSELAETTLRTARMTLFLGTGAAAAVLAVGEPGVRLVFQWGAFSSADAATVSQLLAIYALAIPAWGLHQVIGRSFYAERRMWPPVIIGTLGAAVAVPLSLGLVSVWDAEGLVWASVISMAAYTVALTFFWLRGQDAGGKGLGFGAGAFSGGRGCRGRGRMAGGPLVFRGRGLDSRRGAGRLRGGRSDCRPGLCGGGPAAGKQGTAIAVGGPPGGRHCQLSRNRLVVLAVNVADSSGWLSPAVFDKGARHC